HELAPIPEDVTAAEGRRQEAALTRRDTTADADDARPGGARNRRAHGLGASPARSVSYSLHEKNGAGDHGAGAVEKQPLLHAPSLGRVGQVVHVSHVAADPHGTVTDWLMVWP